MHLAISVKYRPRVLAKTLTLLALATATSVACADDLFANSQFIHKWKDVQLYLKPKTGFLGNWDQEFGIQATVWRSGNLSGVLNFAYDPTYDIRLDQKPRFTLGAQLGYMFVAHPFPVTIYDKPKASPFPYTYKNESGLSLRFYDTPWLKINTNLAYVFTFPFKNNQKPQFLGLVNFQFPLGR